MKYIKLIFSKRNVVIMSFALFILTISIGYSALNTSLNISGDMSLRIAADIRITGNKLSRTVDDAYETYNCNYSKDTTITYTSLPSDTSVADYQATVTNYSDKRYELKDIIVLNNTNSENVSYLVSGLSIGDIVEPGTSVDFIIKVLPVVSRPANSEYTNILELKYVFEEYIPPVVDIYLKDKVLLDNGGTDAISAKGTPTLTQASTTDEGMYATTDNDGTTYYFRGDVKNNYVYFANLYWRIVRINGDGSVRLVYQGTTADATSTATSPGTNKYNDANVLLSSKPAHLLVKYYESVTIQSKVYSAIKTWYESNLTNYSDYLDYNAGYCNDISTTSGTYSDYTNNSEATFSGKTRLANSSPTLECPSTSYITTTAAISGTKKLEYPVALLSMDEVYFAGGYSTNNTNYYLYTGQAFWTMTPYEFVYALFGLTKSANVMYVDTSGKITGGIVTGEYGYRPVINLKANLYYNEGDGTASSPYTIESKNVVDPTPYQNQKTLAETIQTISDEGDDFIYHHDGNQVNGISDGSYRYAGANPNNYICFGSDEATCPDKYLFRMIGVENGNVKLITADYATTEMLGTDGAYIGTTAGTSVDTYVGSQANVATYAYNNSDGNASTNDWNGPFLTTNLNVNFLNQFSSTWQSKIVDSTWYHPEINYFNAILNKASSVYTQEIVDGITSTGKFGVIYNYEYGLSASSGSWGRNMAVYSNSTIRANNWLYLGLKEWTISHGNGGNGQYAATIDANGGIGYSLVYNGLPVRVTFSILGTSNYTSGTGTKTDPYRIS